MNQIYAGEYYVSTEDEFIGTLLGSCVAVCLIDSAAGIAGMNHFMLPGRISHADIFKDRSARYGIAAIAELLGEMEKQGARKENIVAKVFGGGHVMNFEIKKNSIPQENIRLARIILELEDIPIINSNVGDTFTRKLLMDVKDGKVFLKRSTSRDVYRQIEDRDKKLARRIFNEK